MLTLLVQLNTGARFLRAQNHNGSLLTTAGYDEVPYGRRPRVR